MSPRMRHNIEQMSTQGRYETKDSVGRLVTDGSCVVDSAVILRPSVHKRGPTLETLFNNHDCFELHRGDHHRAFGTQGRKIRIETEMQESSEEQDDSLSSEVDSKQQSHSERYTD